MGGSEWMTPAQAAAELGVTPARVRQLADAGRLAVDRTPLGRLISRESVVQMKRQRAAQSVPSQEACAGA